MFEPPDPPNVLRAHVPMHPDLLRKRELLPASTSQSRFHKRIALYRGKGLPVALHHFWWFTHNCIAHPIIGVLPIKATFDFHDFTSRKINSTR